MATTLFAYGTLRPGRAPQEIAHAVDRLRRIGSGSLRGTVHELKLEEYPAAVFSSRSDSVVEGEVFEVPDESVLAELDAYEEYDPAHPKESLYIRKRKRVTMLETGKQRLCWVYEYNRPVPSAARTKERKSA
jgi:gamma-glutamylcyclotransferase (GGCT)/AIG2-like uncharacterized protein YtfP